MTRLIALATMLLATTAAPDGSAVVRVSNPVWSPTRPEIAFDAEVTGSGSEVLVTSADGSHTLRVESRVGRNPASRPLWSPNGQRLALSGVDVDDAHGGTPFVAVTSRAGTTPPQRFGFGNTTPGSWSPDSTRLALNGVDPTNSPTGVAVVDAGVFAIEWPGYSPAWSRRGLIAYVWGRKEVRAPEPTRDFVYTADGKGKHRRRLMRGSNPSWSSDGKLLAYTTIRGVNIATASGRGRRLVYGNRIIGGSQADVYLHWAPHRRLIAVALRGTVIIDATRSRHWRLHLPSGVTGEPSWSPDGRRLVFAAGSRLYIVGGDGKGGHFVTPALD